MKPATHMLILLAVLSLAIVAVRSTIESPYITTEKAAVRKFIRECEDTAMIKENEGIYELRCTK